MVVTDHSEAVRSPRSDGRQHRMWKKLVVGRHEKRSLPPAGPRVQHVSMTASSAFPQSSFSPLHGGAGLAAVG